MPKSRELSRTGILETPKHGKGKLKRGGTNPNAGRPPDEWKQRLQGIVSREEVMKALEEVTADPKHPAYIGALKYASDHAYGKPKETVEHQGEIRHGVVILPAVIATATHESAKKHGKTPS